MDPLELCRTEALPGLPLITLSKKELTQRNATIHPSVGSFCSRRWKSGPFLEGPPREKDYCDLKIAGLTLRCYNVNKVHTETTVRLRNFYNFYQFFK